jgi:hypothetical protein
MKLGVSYNLFDGEELLRYSIECIRNNVDYISVVYQTVSNFGDTCSNNLESLLQELVYIGYIDELYHYEPVVDDSPKDKNHLQETEKRNIGLELSRKNGCTHHMSMDVDEFYKSDQFENMKIALETGDFESGYCYHCQYYKDSIYKLHPGEDELVSTIYKINDDTKFIYGLTGIRTDPTRRTNNEKHKIFTRGEIEMHHLSFVRKDIRKKLMNSSSRQYFKDRIDEVSNYYQNWKYPNRVMWAMGNLLTVIQVERVFQIYEVT